MCKCNVKYLFIICCCFPMLFTGCNRTCVISPRNSEISTVDTILESTSISKDEKLLSSSNTPNQSTPIFEWENIELENLPTKLQKHPATTRESITDGIQLIAENAENDVYLYGLFQPSSSEGNAGGVLLRWGTVLKQFDWDYSTPQQYPPSLQVSDYDGDGELEVGIVLVSGAGMGYKSECFYIAELNLSKQITATAFPHESEIKSIFSDASYQIDTVSNKINFAVRGAEITVDSPFPITEVLMNVDEPLFSIDATHITLETSVYIMQEGQQIPYRIANLTASVRYGNGQFTLSDYSLTSAIH